MKDFGINPSPTAPTKGQIIESLEDNLHQYNRDMGEYKYWGDYQI